MKRLLTVAILLTLVAGSALAQRTKHPPVGTVAQLGTCNAARDGLIRSVTDGDSLTDCATGLSTNTVLCQCDGSAWGTVSSGATGGVQSGTAFPGSPSTYDEYIITNADLPGECIAGAGTDVVRCMYTGAAWVPSLHGPWYYGTFADITVGSGGLNIVAGSVGQAELANDGVTLGKLDTENNPGSNTWVLFNNPASGRMYWASAATGAETDPTLIDSSTIVVGDGSTIAEFTFNGDAGNDGVFAWNWTDDVFEFDFPIRFAPSADPGSSWTDSDTDDDETSVDLPIDCTATGTGAEDCDAWLYQQRGGVAVGAAGSEVWHADASAAQFEFYVPVLFDNLGFEFTASDTNPSCGSDEYRAYADLSDSEIVICENNVVKPLFQRTYIESIAIEDPVTGHSELVQFMCANACTITRIACSTDTGTVDIQFDERAAATPNTPGTNIMASALQCTTTQAAQTSFSDAAIASRVPVNLDIDAVASAPTQLRIFVEIETVE